MTHKKIVAALFLVMFGAETMKPMPSNEIYKVYWDPIPEEEVGLSKIIYCTSWAQIANEVYKHTGCHENENILVGIDMDETLMTGYNIMDDEVIPDFLGTLSTKEIQFFCLTAGISSSWQGRRKRFNKVGLNEIFCNLELNGPFSRSWIEGSDNSKKYYWDFEYSIMYSTIETKYGHKETSKGEVFKSAIEDRIITKPDVMVFIDDLLGNVEDMRLACYQLGINCLGIHCNLPTSSHLKRSHLEQPMYLERLIAETEAGQSKIINCINWDHIINEVVYQHIRHHRDENILVGIDVDDTLIGNHGIIDSRAIPKFFKKLRKREIPFFCFTAAISCFWQKKRVDFKEAGLNNFLCNSVANVPFSRSWQKSLDDSKKYYWDFEYSTMYSTKAKMVSRFFEENPLELGLYQIGDLTKVSKGEVFRNAVEDRIITKPDVMIFIDNLIENVKDVCLACKRLGINCLGIVCKFSITPEDLC